MTKKDLTRDDVVALGTDIVPQYLHKMRADAANMQKVVDQGGLPGLVTEEAAAGILDMYNQRIKTAEAILDRLDGSD